MVFDKNNRVVLVDIFDDIIWLKFFKDYNESKKKDSGLYWSDYVFKLDLGVEYIGQCKYRLVDSKKWMLARIKYGI